MTTLHLGCGLGHQPGAVNVDRYELAAADLQADALRLPLAAGSVAHIEARHLVEHLGYAGTIYALAEWRRVLAPGGSLALETPDRPAACRAAGGTEPPPPVLHWLFGLPRPGYEHRTLFDRAELGVLVTRAGFADVEVSCLAGPLPALRLTARRADDGRADLRARLYRSFVAAGVLDPVTAAPHLAHLESVVDRVLEAAEDLPQAGAQACLAGVLGAAARHDPRAARVAIQALVAESRVSPRSAVPYLALAAALEGEGLPARQVAYLRRNPGPPGSQAQRLQRLADLLSLYLTARLYPEEAGLHAASRAFEAGAANVVPGEGEISFFCAETVAHLARQTTARGVRAWAHNDPEAAQDYLLQAVAYDADNPLPVWNLARLAARQGRRLEALRWYAALLELVPDAGDVSRAELDAATGRAGDVPLARPIGTVDWLVQGSFPG